MSTNQKIPTKHQKIRSVGDQSKCEDGGIDLVSCLSIITDKDNSLVEKYIVYQVCETDIIG